MIEESMGGEAEGAPIPGDAADIFGGGDQATPEEAAPVTAGTTGVTFGSTALAEARDPAFSGLTAGAMLVAALALVALAWATVELTLGGYSQVGQMITENWTMVLMGLGGGVLVAGAIGWLLPGTSSGVGRWLWLESCGWPWWHSSVIRGAGALPPAPPTTW